MLQEFASCSLIYMQTPEHSIPDANVSRINAGVQAIVERAVLVMCLRPGAYITRGKVR
jgi:hypothetical protein